jgi:hypothetical protein
VAGKTVLGQDWPNVSIELDLRAGSRPATARLDRVRARQRHDRANRASHHADNENQNCFTRSIHVICPTSPLYTPPGPEVFTDMRPASFYQKHGVKGRRVRGISVLSGAKCRIRADRHARRMDWRCVAHHRLRTLSPEEINLTH